MAEKKQLAIMNREKTNFVIDKFSETMLVSRDTERFNKYSDKMYQIYGKVRHPLALIGQMNEANIKHVISYVTNSGFLCKHVKLIKDNKTKYTNKLSRLEEKSYTQFRTAMRQILTSYSNGAVLMIDTSEIDIHLAKNLFYHLKSNLFILRLVTNDDVRSTVYDILNNSFMIPERLKRNTFADEVIGNTNSQYSELVREGCMEYALRVTYPTNIMLVGLGWNQSELYLEQGLIPTILDRHDFDVPLHNFKQQTQNVDLTEDGVNVAYSGFIKLQFLFLLAMHYARNNNIKRVVYIGSAPAAQINSMMLRRFERFYNIVVILIDPRENVMNRHGQTDIFDWSDINNKYHSNSPDELLLDDSFLKGSERRQVDIKLKFIAETRSHVFLKVKDTWSESKVIDLKNKLMLLPYVREEWRVIIGSEKIKITQPKTNESYKDMNDITSLAIQRQMFIDYRKMSISDQRQFSLRYFSVLKMDVTECTRSGIMYDATFSLNNTDLDLLKEMLLKTNSHIIFTQPTESNPVFDKYEDVPIQKTIELSKRFYVIPMTTIIGLSNKNILLDFKDDNSVNDIMLLTDFVHTDNHHLFSQPLNAKIQSALFRLENICNNTYRRRYDFINILFPDYFKYDDNNVFTVAKGFTYVGYSFSKDDKVEISGHLFNLLTLYFDRGQPICLKGWLVHMYESVKNYAKQLDSMLTLKEFETSVDALGRPYHVKKDLILTVALIRIMMQNRPQRNNITTNEICDGVLLIIDEVFSKLADARNDNK